MREMARTLGVVKFESLLNTEKENREQHYDVYIHGSGGRSANYL